MVFASPAELNKLGVCEARKLALLARLARGNFLLLVKPPTPASDARFLSMMESLDVGREVGLGGTGNAPILVTFLTALAEGMPEALPTEDDALGRSVVEWDRGVGSADGRDGAFRRLGVDCGRLLRVLVVRG
jgi:hypothetical protein